MERWEKWAHSNTCAHTHTQKGTLTLSSKNSGLMKSSRNQVSGGFSQSAMDLVDRTRKRQEGVNILLHHPLNQYTDGIRWGLKKTGTSWPIAESYNWSHWGMRFFSIRQVRMFCSTFTWTGTGWKVESTTLWIHFLKLSVRVNAVLVDDSVPAILALRYHVILWYMLFL